MPRRYSLAEINLMRKWLTNTMFHDDPRNKSYSGYDQEELRTFNAMVEDRLRTHMQNETPPIHLEAEATRIEPERRQHLINTGHLIIQS